MTISRRNTLKVLGAGAALAAARPAAARVAKASKADDVGMLYDSTRCIGCRACVTRCKDANGLPPDAVRVGGADYDAPVDLNATTKTVVKLWQREGESAYVKTQCMHCADPACTSVCMIGALHKGARGVVEYDSDRCVGCRYCQIACPFNVPKFEWSKAVPRIVKCEMCRHRFADGKGPACAEVCPREAITYGPRAELLAEAHRRIDEAPGRYQAHVYGEREVGGTAVLMLSAVSFSDLGMPALGERPAPTLAETVQHGIYQGAVLPIVLYGGLAAVAWRNRRSGAAPEEKEEER
jgi:Fe-S-cluster-containing dehydrogenase component